MISGLMRFLPMAAALLVALGLARPAAAEAPESVPPERICGYLATEAERILRVPAQLLTAIGLAESGRYDQERQAKAAWPWTVHAEGRGRYLPSRAAALAEVEALQARGVRNIDVGCMQVNLGYHGDAFDSVEHALDPIANVAYAAVFLKQLYEENRSWSRAVAFYHSRTPEHYQRYSKRVMALWNEARRQAFEERRQANEAAYRERLAAKARPELRRVDRPGPAEARHLRRVTAGR